MSINGQQEFKLYITRDWSLKILDPDTTIMPFLKKLKPDFSIQSVTPSADYVPNFQKLRRIYTELSIDDMENISIDTLWDVHNRILTDDISPSSNKEMANLLEIKEELCRRIYLSCSLCPWECGVNRFTTAGRCNLKEKAFFSSIFTHISEEVVINPAINVKLTGCSMGCLYCHTWENLSIDSEAKELNENIWKGMNLNNATTIEFVGGEPIVNLLSILETLNFAPYDFRLPIVWNSNGYTTKTTSSLLQGVIDVYLPDLKYGNNECAHKLSGVNKYLEFVQSGIEATIKSGVKTIVRILVIPGHIECCHLPAIEWLAQFKCYKNLWISVLDQYVPEFKAADIKELNRCPVPAEVEYVEYMAEKNGLKDIDKNPEGFWI